MSQYDLTVAASERFQAQQSEMARADKLDRKYQLAACAPEPDMRVTMVQIVKVNWRFLWYADEVGETFEVYVGPYCYFVRGAWDHEGAPVVQGIAFGDAEEIVL